LIDAKLFDLIDRLLAQFPSSPIVQAGVGSMVFGLAGDLQMKRYVIYGGDGGGGLSSWDGHLMTDGWALSEDHVVLTVGTFW